MTSISTRTKIFREQAGAIRALATARREDGKVFLHADILAALGLPTDKSWQRSLSNWLCKDGIRRRPEYTHKRDEIAADETLPGVLEESLPDTPERDPVTALLADTGRLNEIARALNKISEGMRAVAELTGLYVWTETVHTDNTAPSDD